MNEAIQFINKFQNLNHFFFKLNDKQNFFEFQKLLDNEWECEILTNLYVRVNKVGSKARNFYE